ncbi:MAG TPA: carboxypeptidase regulatory-like domain-containing protein [Anaerolineales bacterium]|nr:carboxypeptidase regulatory-like domain-containing protein [Anaerolineales bacterium]
MRFSINDPVTRRWISLVSLFILVLNACSFSLLDVPGLNISTPTAALPPGPTATPQPSAAITFTVAIPSPLPAGEVLNLSVLDEVTGLGLNPVNYVMQGMDTLHYTVTIPFAMNSVVKYRYTRQGTLPTPEDDWTEKQVRYRMYAVTGPGSVNDVVSSWADSLFNSPFGRISGRILDSSNNSPLPNILIAVGGQQILTDSNGRFNVEGLPAGTHNLVAYAIDGAYQVAQQGARVDVGKTTQVDLSLAPATMVSVTFTVSVPPNTIKNVPIRLAGNLYQLGNTFSDLQGGLATVATRMPLLTPQADGRYSLTINLPAGADIRYKYTLGDGFWNAEHGVDGSFIVRQLIVPPSPSPLQIQDAIQTWQAGASSPILFELSVPSNTPVSDIPSIQFNPYGWTEPIPMWSRGNNQWVYQLYSPLNMLGDFEYRFCRNDQCGVADDAVTAPGQRGRPVSSSLTPQDLQDTVDTWTWFQPPGNNSLVGFPVTPRGAGFWAGVEFLPQGDPTWQSWNPLAIQNVQGLYANWLVLRPTWTVSRTSPFVFAPVPGSDALWSDDLDTIGRARAANLNVALFPVPNLPADPAAWWTSSPRSPDWWGAWFDRYAAFAAYHADLAAKSGAQALILGGDWLSPALPGGTLSDGSSSGVPADAETRWQTILADVRSRFKGQVLWAVTYPGGLQSVPDFVSSLDGAYVLWNAPLTGSSVDQLHASIGQLLDTDIQPFQKTLNKPVILALAYASANGSANAAIPAKTLFAPGDSQNPINLQAQTDIYQAFMAAVNERAWVGGVVSRGYYPPVELSDASASVHAKPAADVLWYWFPRFLGVVH